MATTRDFRETRLAISDGVAEFSHQRPAARNAISMEMRADYQDMISVVESDSSIRALIITGSGGSFCAGGDVKGMASRTQNGEPGGLGVAQSARLRLIRDHRVWIDRLRQLDLPVIAAVDGPAVGAGLSIMLMTDFTLCSTRAIFSAGYSRVGLVPDFGAFYTLPRVVGLAKAKELMMTARGFGPQEAKELGLVYAIHEPEELLAEAHKLASRLSRGPRDALGMIKNTLNRSFEVDYQTMVEIEAHQQAVALTTPYHHEAVQRFANREPSIYDWDRM